MRAISELTTNPFFALPIQQWPQTRGIRTVEDGIDLGRYRLQMLKQSHSGGSLGYRLGRFGYVTDCTPSAEHVPFLQGAELVLMDTMFDRRAAQGGDSTAQHGDSISNAEIARDAGVAHLGLIHLDPDFDEGRVDVLLAEARTIFPNAFLPVEGNMYRVSAPSP